MTFMVTHSGRRFDVASPEPDMVEITDIAIALSRVPRFTGHTKQTYSVAQHSFHCSEYVDQQSGYSDDNLALQALLHDATEAYVSDLCSPIKDLCPDYRRLEKRIWHVIAAAFGVPEELDPVVKEADLILLATEKRDLVNAHGDAWPILEGVTPLDRQIMPWTERTACFRFLDRFYELTGRAAA